jgi:DNA-binding MarR family transcriptional regulator
VHEDLPSAAEIARMCVNMNVQRAARSLARRYDAALRPSGLTSGQFAVLAALNRRDAPTLGELARVLGVDRTTLTRNLRPLLAEHLVHEEVDVDDARRRPLRLSAEGRQRLRDAMPHWREVQTGILARLDDAQWPVIRTLLAGLS